VAAYINCPVDEYLQVGIDLDDTLVISFVPVVTTPWFISNVFELEIFVRWKLVMSESSFPAFSNRCFKDSI
jgi:hypothetical protein